MRENYTIVETIEETDSWGLYVATKNGNSYFLEKFTDQNKAEKCLSIATTIYKCSEGLSIENEFSNGRIYIFYKVNKIQGSLNTIFSELSFSKKQSIIIDTVNILQKIHNCGLIHNNLCLENCFLFNSQSVFLTGFYKSVSINNTIANYSEVSEKVNPLYISPELTGKTNIPISIQSDFYALGVLMYKLFTERYPFENEDFSALSSMHLAKNPESPLNINSDIPENLSQIIMKLLEKNPEHRYKSHQGIIYDLEHISSIDFQLGAKDFDLEFKISHKIYGREAEINCLKNAFEKVKQGSFQMVIIAGYSGVGKSALIEEMNHFEDVKGLHFLRGKFQQYKSNIPYFAFVEALQIYFDKLLLSNNLELERFCSEFKKNIGDRGRVLTSLFPKLEFIVGKQAPITQFVGVEAENRFILTFLEFLKIIATKESPLILFLDDLQWTDLVSLTILKSIIKEQIGYVFIGLAYRDNEVDLYHPFHYFMDEIKLLNENVQHINLLDLKIQDITQLLVESRIDNPEELAVIIHKKTGGNSFFIHQYIRRCVQNKFLDCLQGNNLWHADIEAISGMEASDNIVEFMQQTIKHYDDGTTSVLKILGALGHNAEYNIIEIVLKKSKTELQQLLSKPFANNLLTETATNIRFTHDKIQQACYQLNSKNNLPKIHYDIACLFIENDLYNTIDDLFSVVSHLNNGFEYVKKQKEKFFDIYFEAAIKSKEISAYSEYLEFIQKAMQLLYPNISEELKYKCYCEYHVALHLNGKYDEADEFFEDKLLNYSNIYALKDNYVTKVSQDSMLGKYKSATVFGLSILEKMDIHINMSPDIDELTEQLRQLRVQFEKRGINDVFDLVKMPKREPDEMKFICELISAIIPGSFFFNPLISSLLIFETIRIALKNGVYSSMGYPFSVATVPFILVENNYVRGAKYAEFAMQISENDQRSLGNSKHLYILFCWHWIYPLKNNKSLEIAREAFHLLLKGGDIQMSGFIFFNTIPYLFERGETLEEVLVEVKRGLDYAEKTANFHARGPYTVFKQFVLSMMTGNASVEQFGIDGFSEKKYLEENKENAMGRCFLYIYKTQYLYMYKEYDKAFEYVNKSREVLGSITGFIPIATHYFYGALCFCRKYRDDPQIANDLDNYIAQLKQWADQVPENWQQKYYLIMAEKNKYSEDKSQTINFYVKAISTAEENGFTQDIALARELFSDYWYERGSKELGNALLEMSCKSYEKWGAIRKIQFIKDRNPQLANLFRVKDNDLRNIIKAQNLLAQETHIDVLLRKVMMPKIVGDY
jgi:predicted ATPase